MMTTEPMRLLLSSWRQNVSRGRSWRAASARYYYEAPTWFESTYTKFKNETTNSPRIRIGSVVWLRKDGNMDRKHAHVYYD